MRSKLALMLGASAAVLAACATSPTEAPTVEPIQTIIPTVSVSDQDASAGFVVIDRVVAAEDGWVVIHLNQEGAPGPVLGFALVGAGESADVRVEIDLDQAGSDLFAMLHVDQGQAGVYEFPGEDGPVRVGEAVVNVPFAVTLPEIQGSVTVTDQDASEGMVTISEVVSPGPGWVVIHADAEGAPGPVVGYAPVIKGSNSELAVEIDLTGATPTLYAMLHLDAGVLGEYKFPGEDVPVRHEEVVVVTPFAVEVGTSGDSPTVIVLDSSFRQKEITVPVGTTVLWDYNASLPHTVTSDDDLFNSGTMGTGDVFSFTFTQAGTYRYYCEFHGGSGGSGMSGIVTVTEG